MKKIIVLGAGLVGKAITIDLAQNHEVTSVDLNENALDELGIHHKIHTVKANLTEYANIKDLIKEYDLVIGAVPGFMGFNVLKSVIEAGKNIVDISFFDEDPFLLDELAKKNNVTAVTDCGVAPGMSNLILGYHNQLMKIESFECYVAGLPVKPEWPWKYKAVFSPIDVIEEYIRPARIVENSKIIIKPALSEPEILNFEKVGPLEAFNTDGLRSLVKTMTIPNMKEKTMRYPGTIDYLKVLRETGYFDKEPVKINGTEIRPIDLTAKVMFPKWKLKDGEEDFTVMRIIIKDKHQECIYDLYDRYDKNTNTISMARTTGYTCTAVANLVLEKKFIQKGVCPPEYIGANAKCFNEVIEYLKQRNVIYKFRSSITKPTNLHIVKSLKEE